MFDSNDLSGCTANKALRAEFSRDTSANAPPAGKIQWSIYGPLQVRLDSQLL